MSATPPRPGYWAAGFFPQATDFNTHINNDITFLTKKTVFRAWQQVVQSIPGTSTSTVLTLDTVIEDTYSGWTSGASNKYTAQVDGWYLVIVTYFSNGGSGAGNACSAFINVNDGPFIVNQAIGGQKYPIAATTGWAVQLAMPLYLSAAVGGSVQPMAWQNTGSPLNTFSSGITQASSMEIIWVSE